MIVVDVVLGLRLRLLVDGVGPIEHVVGLPFFVFVVVVLKLSWVDEIERRDEETKGNLQNSCAHKRNFMNSQSNGS
jgi:hypothetical protein